MQNKKTVVFLFFLSLSATAVHARDSLWPVGRGKDPCRQFKCHTKRGEERIQCRKNRRSCLKDDFDKQVSKWKDKGIPTAQKKELFERLNQDLEHEKAEQEDLNDNVSFLQEKLEKIKNLQEAKAEED